MSEFASLPLPPESHEELSLRGLIVLMQHHRENARQLQADQLDAHLRARQPMRRANYMIQSLNEEGASIPAQHERVLFAPQFRRAIRHSIAQLVVRYPLTAQDFYPEPPSTQPWNDVFIEAWNEEGIPQNYLLNSKGLVPFKNAQTDVVSDETFYMTGDLFTVHKRRDFVPSLSVAAMTDLLKIDAMDDDAYVYMYQTNEEEQPYIPEA